MMINMHAFVNVIYLVQIFSHSVWNFTFRGNIFTFSFCEFNIIDSPRFEKVCIPLKKKEKKRKKSQEFKEIHKHVPMHEHCVMMK